MADSFFGGTADEGVVVLALKLLINIDGFFIMPCAANINHGFMEDIKLLAPQMPWLCL